MRKNRYYIIGIGGSAMASLAGLLKQKGYEVAGSDQDMYEPMASMLKALKIKVFSPYNAFHMKRYKADVVIVGNAISRGNPEVEHMLSIGQVYRSAPDVLKEEFLERKKNIVVTGTHGKTTTTALIAWILEYAGLDPTVFVGGMIIGFPPKADQPRAGMRNINSSFKLGVGSYAVIEGDEYDTAFFDKSPKFMHYRPFIGLINNIEFEHVDVYKDISMLRTTFSRFANLIPESGLLVMNQEDENTKNIEKHVNAKFHMKRFGVRNGDYTAEQIMFSSTGTTFKVNTKNGKVGPRQPMDINTKLIGQHNVSNILGAIAVARFLKIPISKIKKAIATFQGVKRRTEILGEKKGVIIIDDYAHHPTAVSSTLDALRNTFHMKRLVVMFEPGSASAKRNIFEKQFVEALGKADSVYLYKPFKAKNVKPSDLFNGHRVSRQLRNNGTEAKYFDNIEKLLFHMKQNVRPNDVIVIMSCRGFDGLREKIFNYL